MRPADWEAVRGLSPSGENRDEQTSASRALFSPNTTALSFVTATGTSKPILSGELVKPGLLSMAARWDEHQQHDTYENTDIGTKS